uniref:DUF7903 domain-containing protein n=1 Tax=Solanum tuberosum TaxID=4113 RepID=M1BVV5_SOLTU
MKHEMEEADMAQVKPSVVARFGKILFHGNSSICEESQETTPLSEANVRKMTRKFYANSPAAFTDYIEHRVVEKLELEYVKGKELYNIRLSDRLRPNSFVTCKCTVAKDYNKIELYKDEQINGIKDLIGSAVLDSEVQGGLRVEMAHWQGFFRWSIYPFDFKSSTGEVTQEIFLKMPGIISELRWFGRGTSMLEVSSSKPLASESKGFAFWVELVAPGLPSVGYLSYVVCCSEGIKNELIETPWLLIAANVKKDLLLSFQHMKREMEEVGMAQDEEINEIKDLIGSAIVDSEVPAGLRWPLNKRHSSGGRYVVNVIGHTTAKSYRNSSIRFKFRHAN